MPKKKVNLEKIIDAAEEVSQEDHFDNLTLVRVAEKLDIKSPSLFNHVKGLADLKKQVTIRGLQKMRDTLEAATHEKTREAAIMALSLAYRDFAKSKSGLYESIRGLGPLSEEDIADAYYSIMKLLVKVFETAGLIPDEQVHQARALRAMLHGFVELERAGSFHLAKDLDWSFARMISIFAKSAFDPDWTG